MLQKCSREEGVGYVKNIFYGRGKGSHEILILVKNTFQH